MPPVPACSSTRRPRRCSRTRPWTPMSTPRAACSSSWPSSRAETRRRPGARRAPVRRRAPAPRSPCRSGTVRYCGTMLRSGGSVGTLAGRVLSGQTETRTVPADVSNVEAVMGVFFDPHPSRANLRSTVEAEIRDALQKHPGEVADVDDEAAGRAAEAIDAASTTQQFKATNFLVALGVLLFFVIAAIVTEALDLDESSVALFGFAAITLGIIVGLLGGEKSATS